MLFSQERLVPTWPPRRGPNGYWALTRGTAQRGTALEAGACAPEGRLLVRRVFAVHIPLPNLGLLLIVIFRSSDTCSGETLS